MMPYSSSLVLKGTFQEVKYRKWREKKKDDRNRGSETLHLLRGL
jgi:hypothetical protein